MAFWLYEDTHVDHKKVSDPLEMDGVNGSCQGPKVGAGNQTHFSERAVHNLQQ